MLSRLGKILRIHADEGPVVFFLFANSFLAGVVLAFYYPPAISLFLSHFDSGDLPPAFILQAIFAYAVSLLFRKLKARFYRQGANLQRRLHVCLHRALQHWDSG